MRRAAFVAVVFCLTESASSAAEVIWAGAGSSTWSTGSNWVEGSVPATTDIAAFKGWAPLPRTSWTVTASLNSGNGSNTKDGRGSTYWQTGALQASGQWVKIDLGSTQTFGGIDIDNTLVGASSTDYPRGFDIYSSSDGSSWGTAFYSGTGSASKVSPRFSDQTARYIKIQLNTGNGTYWWTIGELTVWNTAGDAQFATTSMTASASASAGGAASNVIDWDLSTVWSPGANQVNGQWIELDLGANRTFSSITMDAYSRAGDYPRGYNVEVSTNNSSWSSVATGNPSGEFNHVTFTAQTARYIRVTQTGSVGNWWSMYELHVYGTPSNVTTSASTTLAGINHTNSITFTQASGHTITLTGDWNQSAGTFAGGNSQISVAGDFNLSGGTHTATSSIMEVTGAFNKTGGTFTHNSGRVLLDSTTNQTFATNGATFYDLAINDGLLAYWKLDESASPAVDSSGWGRSATWAGSTTSSATVPTVNFTDSRSMSLSSTTNDRATFTSPTVTDVTITAWVYSSARNNAFPRIVETPAYQLSFTDNNQVAPQVNNCVAWSAITNGAQFGYRTTHDTITDGTWYHIAATMTSAGVGLIYINGAVQSTTQPTAGSGTVISNAGASYIGNRAALDRGWTGRLDDLRIYNRILSASEINALYIGNQPGTGLATQTMTGTPTVLSDFTIASGKFAAGSNNITVGASWNNFGGIFTSSGTVSLTNGCCTEVIRSAGQPFYNLQLNGVNGIWNLEDWLKVSNTLSFFQNGTLSPGSYAIHAGNISKTSGTLTAGTGTVVLDNTADVTESSGFSFNNLRVEATDETGLVGYWKFDEGQGNTVRDASGTGNDGTLTSPRWTDTLPGTIGFDNHAALSFNASTTVADLGVTSLPANNASQTISFWANFTNNSSNAYIITLWDASMSGTSVGINSSNLQAWSWGPTTLVSLTPPATGGWHHVAYTFDGTTHKLYLDGGTPNTSTNAANTHAVTHAQLGGYNGSASFNGLLDDVRIYNVALTATQIKNLAAGRYSGKSSNTTFTLGANSSASGALSIDNGTLATGTYTMNASAAGNVVAVGSGGTYSVGSATQTMAGGLTVSNGGTLNMPTASGTVAIGSGKTLTMDGTLSASSATAAIQSVSGTYTFSIGSSPTATPTLNITGLKVKNTDANGMNINVDHGAVTTFTRFDNIAFTNGAGTGAGNYNLQVYATSLFLPANGCTFDSGVTATVANNVKLTGNGTGDGETRIMFGNATCASDKASCEAYDSDDDSAADGVGDNPGGGGNAAVIQWIKSAQADTSGSIEGFPTAAFDWSSFTYYSTYVGYHDANGTADRVYVRTSNGSAATATYYWESASGDDIIGSPRWDTVSGTHYVYVATTSCKVYRLIDDTTNHTLLPDTVSPWDGANNPYTYPTGCTITSPLAQDSNNVYWGGITTVGSTPKLWTLSKTSSSPRLPAGSPLNTTVTSNNTAPAIWTSGDTYAFLGLTAEIAKLDITTMAAAVMNTNPGSGNAVTGRISVIANTLYAGDDNGYMWSLPPGGTFGGTTKNWGYHDAGCASNCQVKSHYVDAQYSRVYYGNQAGKVYVLNSSGSTISASYPYLVNTSSEAFATAPLYRQGTIVIGATNGYLFIINQDTTGGGVPGLKQTYRFGTTGTSVSGVAFDNGSASYMVSTANATNKDGKLYYISSSDDSDGHI